MASLPSVFGKPAPLPQLGSSFAQQDPVVLLAMCNWGEARGELWPTKIAQLQTVRNRVRLDSGEFGRNWVEVILRPGAFSCFNPNDPNYSKLWEPTKYETSATWEACYTAASLIYNDSPAVSADATNGAIFYHDISLAGPPMRQDGSCVWGPVELTLVSGRLKFYRRA